MKKITFIALIITLIFYSCQKKVKIDIPDDGRKLVVNSLFEANSLLTINITKSKHILDETYYGTYSGFYHIPNAKVSLFKNNVFLENLTEMEQGNYKSTFLLTDNAEYSISVKADNFEEVTAKNTIPKSVEINKFEFNDYTEGEYGSIYANFSLEFTDDGNIENYYLLEMYKKHKYTIYNEETEEEDTFEDIYPIYITPKDLRYEQTGYNEALFFDDNYFNGTTLNFQFSVYSYSFYGEEQTEETKDKYYIYLNSVSKEYYLYVQSLDKHQYAKDDFFAEPVQVYNNIENGFGIFAGISSAVDSVEVDIYNY